MLVAALGIDGEGHKHPLALIEGATENAAVVQALIDNLIERGLDAPTVTPKPMHDLSRQTGGQIERYGASPSTCRWLKPRDGSAPWREPAGRSGVFGFSLSLSKRRSESHA